MVSRPGHKLKITLLPVADVLSNGSAEVRMLFDNLASKVCALQDREGWRPSGSIGMDRVIPLDLGIEGRRVELINRRHRRDRATSPRSGRTYRGLTRMVADQQTWFRRGIDWDESAKSFKPWDEGAG
jgi:hypothetical protein